MRRESAEIRPTFYEPACAIETTSESKGTILCHVRIDAQAQPEKR